ncbi:MAG: N-acyl homoserine lactonase family protein [Siphonobacter sp.]
MIRIHILHCGGVFTDEATPFYSKSLIPPPFIGFFRNRKKWLPVSVYLIEHPKGLILVDTGWHTAVRTSPKKHLGFLHYLAGIPELPVGQAITEQLHHLGYKPADIDFVILTHLHDDHISGIELLKEAKNFLVSEVEIADTQRYKRNYTHALWKNVPLKPFQFIDSEYGPEKKSFDLFGDESVVLVSTPGHTNGQVSVLIQNSGWFVLLCSDTAYAQKSWGNIIIPGITVNQAKAYASLRWVREMSQQPNAREIIANHDPDVQPHTIEV